MWSRKACAQGETTHLGAEIGEMRVFLCSTLPMKHSLCIKPYALYTPFSNCGALTPHRIEIRAVVRYPPLTSSSSLIAKKVKHGCGCELWSTTPHFYINTTGTRACAYLVCLLRKNVC